MNSTEVEYNKSFGELISMRFLDSSKYTDFILDSLSLAPKTIEFPEPVKSFWNSVYVVYTESSDGNIFAK